MSELSFERFDPKFVENMKTLLKDEYQDYVRAMNQSPVRGVRVNPIKMNKDTFIETFGYPTERVPYEENGFVLLSEEKIGNPFHHLAGAIYLQEPSSMMPVACLNVSSDAKVLDLCAAPGGKSTQVAAKIQNGLLVSNEIVTSRAKVLFSNIERLGVKNAIILNETPEKISNKLKGYFDAVIVDAPCGGEGMFRKDPNTIAEWKEERLISNHDRQLEILNCADKCLKQGGKLVYSTCTFSEIEDEDVIVDFLKDHDYRVVEVPEDVKSSTKNGTKIREARRFYPFSGKGEGQFVCVLGKQSDCENVDVSRKTKLDRLSKQEDSLARKFLAENFDIDFEFELIVLHECIMLVTNDMMEICGSGLNIISAGVRVGTIEKGVLRPHHQLFMALGKYAKNKIELDDKQAQRYVHGEELNVETLKNGYYALQVHGATIGGSKCSGGRLKNLYPKGLRI